MPAEMDYLGFVLMKILKQIVRAHRPLCHQLQTIAVIGSPYLGLNGTAFFVQRKPCFGCWISGKEKNFFYCDVWVFLHEGLN